MFQNQLSLLPSLMLRMPAIEMAGGAGGGVDQSLDLLR